MNYIPITVLLTTYVILTIDTYAKPYIGECSAIVLLLISGIFGLIN